MKKSEVKKGMIIFEGNNGSYAQVTETETVGGGVGVFDISDRRSGVLTAYDLNEYEFFADDYTFYRVTWKFGDIDWLCLDEDEAKQIVAEQMESDAEEFDEEQPEDAYIITEETY